MARVLILDIERIKTLDLKYVIQSMGHEVLIFKEDIKNNISEFNPDLIIIDDMVLKDQKNALNIFKEINNTEIPFIYLTIHSKPTIELEKKIYKNNLINPLIKPFDEIQLKNKVQSLLKHVEKRSLSDRIHIGGVSNKELLYYLILPLSALTILFAILSYFFNGESFLTNLTTEFISIVVTVSYVNWVFKKHKVKKWEDADRRIKKRLEILTNSYITTLRTNFKLTFIFFDGETFNIRNSTTRELLIIARETLIPIIFLNLLVMDEKSWIQLIEQLEILLKQIDRILMFYGTKLNPKKYSLLLDIQDDLEDIIKEYEAFKDIFNYQDPSNLDKHLKSIIAGKLKRVLNLFYKLDLID